MPIQTECAACGHIVRAADQHAGMKARCPKCQAVIQIPALNAAASGPDAWLAQSPTGEQFGPLARAELERWAAEGRLTGEWQLLQDGWSQWKWADEVLPQRTAAAPSQPAPSQPAPSFPRTGLTPQAAPASHPPAPKPAARIASQGLSNPLSTRPGGLAGNDSAAAHPGDLNPFAAPQASGPPTHDHTAGGDGMDDAHVAEWVLTAKQTQPWVRLLSLLGFIVLSLLAIGIVIGSVLSPNQTAPAFAMVLVLFLVVVGGVGGSLCYFLFRYQAALKAFVETRGAGNLEEAILTQRSFWVLYTIVGAIATALSALSLLIT